MSEQQFTDFFDPEIQKIVSEDGCSIYRMKNVTGEGVITRYEILPGIELFYNDFHMSDGQNQNKLPHSDVLEINHCREGRFECEFANGDYQYVGAGDLAINRLTNETTSTYFPLSHYHGISITIDLPTADQTMKRIESVIGGLNIDVFSIADKFCKNDTCVVLRTQSEIEHIFSELGRQFSKFFFECFGKFTRIIVSHFSRNFCYAVRSIPKQDRSSLHTIGFHISINRTPINALEANLH